MSENPELTVLRNQHAYQVEFANQQGEILGDFIHQAIELKARLRLTEGAIQQLQKSNEAYKDRNDNLKQELDQVKAELAAAKSNIEAFEVQNGDMRSEISQLRERKAVITGQRQEAQEELEKTRAEIQNLQIEIEALKEQEPQSGKRRQAQKK